MTNEMTVNSHRLDLLLMQDARYERGAVYPCGYHLQHHKRVLVIVKKPCAEARHLQSGEKQERLVAASLGGARQEQKQPAV